MGGCFSIKPERISSSIHPERPPSIKPYTSSHSTRAFEVIDNYALSVYKLSISSVTSSGKGSERGGSLRKGDHYIHLQEQLKKETERQSKSYPNLRKIYFKDTPNASSPDFLLRS